MKPFIHSGSEDTWAPSGAVIVNNYLFFAGLRGSAIYRLNLETKQLKEFYKNQLGRIRTIAVDIEENFYILTSNTDGRGDPKENDDKLIKINKTLLINN